MLLLVFRFLLAAAGKIEGSFVARHSIFREKRSKEAIL